MGKDTLCRVEESCNLKRPVIQAINQIFNPNEMVEMQIAEQRGRLSQIESIVTELLKGQKNDKSRRIDN